MDPDSLCFALAEEDLDGCIFHCKRADRTERQSKDSQDNFRADAKNDFFRALCS